MQQNILLLSYYFLVIGYSYNKGWFSIGGLILLISGIFLLAVAFLQKDVKPNNNQLRSTEQLCSFGLIMSIALSIDLWNHDMNGFISLAMLATRFLMWISLGLAVFYLIPFSQRLMFFQKYKFPILIIFALLTRLLMLKIIVEPEVDIFYNLKYRARAPLELINPYSTSYQYPAFLQNRNYTIYPYGPFLFPIIIPFDLLGDPRLALITADFITAIFLYKLLKKFKRIKELIPLTFIFAPQSLFFASLSAVDNIIVALFTSLFYFFKTERYFLAYLTFTFIGGIKHAYYVTILYSFKRYLSRKIFKPLMFSIFLLFLGYGFFALLDFKGLINNLFGISALTHTWIVPASLSFQAFLTKQTIVSPWLNFKPSIIFGLIPFFLISLITFFYLNKSLYKMSLAMTISLFSFIFFSPYALIQYYTVVSSLTLIAFCLSLDKEKDHA